VKKTRFSEEQIIAVLREQEGYIAKTWTSRPQRLTVTDHQIVIKQPR
jgi:hypothetical protein